jgi:hypothetical protein
MQLAYTSILGDADDTLYSETVSTPVSQADALSGRQGSDERCTVFDDAQHLKPDGTASKKTDVDP